MVAQRVWWKVSCSSGRGWQRYAGTSQHCTAGCWTNTFAILTEACPRLSSEPVQSACCATSTTATIPASTMTTRTIVTWIRTMPYGGSEACRGWAPRVTQLAHHFFRAGAAATRKPSRGARRPGGSSTRAATSLPGHERTTIPLWPPLRRGGALTSARFGTRYIMHSAGACRP